MSTQTMVAVEHVLHIPLSSISLSKTNPRTRIDDESLADLAADIRHRGVQQPILVRPVEGAEGKYELVFGERRYRASQKAEKATIPSIVREMSDEDAYELQVIENLQREDLHPLDEAEAFQRLYANAFEQTKSHDESLKFVAAKVGKKPEFVATRRKLLDLTDRAKAAFRKGDILLGHAIELARLRENEQKKALKWMLETYKDIHTGDGWKQIRVMPGVPELRLWIRENLFLDLSQAPFDTTDASLNPQMGACTECQFRTGNQPALFSDVKKGDICTAPPCWVLKRNASVTNLAASTAKELGAKSVLKVGIGHATWNDSKVPVDEYIDYGSSARIVKPGTECEHTKPGIITWIGHAGDSGSLKVGATVQVCTKAAECPAHKKVDSRGERPTKSFEKMADTRIMNLRKELPQRVRAALIRAVVENAQKDRRRLSAADKVTFELLAGQMHHDLYFDRHRDLCKLMEVEAAKDKSTQTKDWRASSLKMFEGNPIALMVTMVLMHRYHTGHYGGPDADPLKPLLRVYKVDAKTIAKRIKAETDAKIAAIQAALKKRKARKTPGRSDARTKPMA